MKNFKQDQQVKYKFGDMEGTGKIVGKALNNQPVIGGTYIIEPDKSIENEAYNYSIEFGEEDQNGINIFELCKPKTGLSFNIENRLIGHLIKKDNKYYLKENYSIVHYFSYDQLIGITTKIKELNKI